MSENTAESDALRPDDLAALRAAHRDSFPMGNIHHGTPERPDWGTFCMECTESWPCTVTRLLDHIDMSTSPAGGCDVRTSGPNGADRWCVRHDEEWRPLAEGEECPRIRRDREHFMCHRDGDRCTWDGCPNQHDDKACEGCFLIQSENRSTPGAPA